jgi:cell division protein ZapD
LHGKETLSDTITFEHPLNERTRLLLRFAHLFEQFAVYHHRSEAWDSRAAVSALVDISSLLNRTDTKSEILKELKRDLKKLEGISNTSNVDTQRLGSVMDSLENAISGLGKVSGPLGQELRDDEFLKNIAQRSTVPGCNCAFDMPHYHYWLQLPPEQRVEKLDAWFRPLMQLQQAVSLLVELIRISGGNRQTLAQRGFYQQKLEASIPVQLIRVTIPYESRLIAEISGGKHRFSVRFMGFEQQLDQRPEQVYDDIPFQLAVCVM